MHTHHTATFARRLLPGLASLALAACGASGAFTTTYPDGRPESVTAVEAQLAKRKPSPGQPVAVGATRDNRQVFAYDLAARRLLWRVDASPSSPPQVAGDVVVIHEPGRVRLVALQSGALLEERADQHMALMGADGDGNLAAVVMSSGGSIGARSALWILVDGKLHSELDVHYALGAPAVAGGLVFVPWNNVFLSVLDPEGAEVARIRIHEDVVSRAFSQDGEVYFGQLGLFRFDSELLRREKGPAVYFRPRREALPGRPAFMQPANKPPPPVQSALHRVKLSFRADPTGERLGLARDHLYLSFYQQVFALHPSEPRADWVYSHERDIVGMQAGAAGVWLADEAGNVTLLDGQGLPRFETPLGVEPAVVQFRVDGFAPALSPAPPSMPLADQLAQAAMHPDARLVPSRAMAVEMLGALEGEAPSAHLVALCADGQGPRRVQQAACDTLAARTSGKGPVLDALAEHENFLTGTRAPPVGPLALAAMHMQAREALPLLLAHLRDPATPVQHLPPLMEAIKKLADERVEAPTHAFLMLYHAYDEDPALLKALELSMDTLAQQRGAKARPTLELVANDAHGLPPLRGYAAQLLATLPQPEPEEDPEGEGDGEEELVDAEEAASAATDEDEDPPAPGHLTASLVRQSLSPVMTELRACLRNDPRHPASARLTIVASGEGDVVLVRALPEYLQPCLAPLVQSVTFPANKYARRQQLTYRLDR